MAVIREDVVSIGFDVARNPFAELTAGINDIKTKLGIFNDTERGLREVGEEARTAGRDLEGLSDSIHAPPDAESLARPLVEVQNQAERAGDSFSGLTDNMEQVGQEDLSGGVEALAASMSEPITGFKDLAGKAKAFAKMGLNEAVDKLPPGIKQAVTGAGNLLGKAKDIAAIGFKKTVSGLKNITSEAGKAAMKLGKGLLKGAGRLAIGVTAGVTAASGALGAGAIAAYKFGSAYETSLAKVSTMVDTNVISLKDLSGQVMDLSNATGEDATGLNEAVYQALSAGANSAEVVDLVGTAVKAAKGGFTDAETAVDGLTSTLNAYGMATSDAEGLANQFLITQNKGKTTFGELASNIGGVAPTAKAAGVGVDELLSGVASLTANGIGTSEAMTGIKAAMSNIIKPSAEAAKTAKKLGLNFSTAELQSKGLAGFLDEVKTATGGNTDTMAQLFGSVEALNTVLTLTSDQGSQLMNDTLSEMATNTTALDDAYNTMSDTAENSVKKGINSFKNLGIGIYQANEGPVAELTGLFSKAGDDLYNAFKNGGFEGLVGQIGDTLANTLTTITGYLPDLINGGVEVVDSLIDGIMQNRDQISNSIINGLKSLLIGIIQIAPKLLVAGVALIASLIEGVAQSLPTMGPMALEAGKTFVTGLVQYGPTILNSGIEIIKYLGKGLLDSLPSIVSNAIILAGKLVGAIIKFVRTVNWLDLGIKIVKGIGKGVVDGIKGLFGKNRDSGKEAVENLAVGMDEAKPLVESSAGKTSEGITTKIDSTNLYGSGQNIMSGLNNGMLSMQGNLNTTASNIGTGISTNLNKSLDIHSPSRVTEETGEYTDLGLVKGMEGMSGKVEKAARNVGDTTAKSITPYKSRYSPATDQSAGGTNSSNQVNHWNPVFNLTLNGASASDSNERKVKRWTKAAIKESMEGMGRTNPRLQEV